MFSARVCGAGVIFGLVLFSWNVLSGDAIHCYECNSHIDEGCDAKKPPDTYKINCTDKYNDTSVLCRKTVLHTNKGVKDKESEESNRVIRGCGWYDRNYNNTCYKRTGSGWQQVTCACSHDYCNGAEKLSLTSVTIGLLLISVAYIL